MRSWIADRPRELHPTEIQLLYISHIGRYTLCLKKFPPLNSLQLWQILFDCKVFALLKSVWNLLQNPYNITHLTLGTLLHYLGKLKVHIFCNVHDTDTVHCQIVVASSQWWSYGVSCSSRVVVYKQMATRPMQPCSATTAMVRAAEVENAFTDFGP